MTTTSSFLLLLRRRWWLLLVGLVPTVLVTGSNVSGQPPVYESTSTFVVRPVQADAERVMRAMDTLLRGVEINTTYANIVGSRFVEDRALERLDLTNGQRAGLSANGKVITGTSILEIRVTAGEPEVARDFAEAVADETLSYINELENGFGLVPLDAPTLPRSASGPMALLTVAVSGLLGTVLGLGLVFASGQLLPLGGVRRFDIIDPVTGAYTEAFFVHRLREEVARIDRSGGALTVVVLVPSRAARFGRFLPQLAAGPGLARTADILRGELLEGDLLAHLGRGRFAVLAPDRLPRTLGAQLRATYPDAAFRVSEITYRGDRDEGNFDDLQAFLASVDVDIHRGGLREAESLGARSEEPKESVWSGWP